MPPFNQSHRMNVPLQPLKAVPCTIPGCYHSFDTIKDMKRHKKDEPTHFYCKKCDLDFEDWASLLAHKVEAMAPFLEKRADRRPPGNPPHLVCEFCGEDFKSSGGRLLHRERMHPADQCIKCPGYVYADEDSPCREIFTRAGAMIAHIEDDECEAIRSWELFAKIQHKYVKKEIMKDLETFTDALQINSAFAPPNEPGLIEDDDRTTAPTDTEIDGGVLLDHEDEEQKGGLEPLEAKMASINLGGKTVPLTRSNLEAWPRLPGQTTTIVPESILSGSVGSPPPSVISTSMSASQFASEITSRRGSVKVYTESQDSLHGDSQDAHTGLSPHGYDDDGAASVATAKPAKAKKVLPRPAAWTTTGTSRELFGDVKAPPQTDQIKSILKKRRESQERAPNLLLNARWWDPTSDDYSPERFKHSVLQQYCCPFKATCDIDPVDDPYIISQHLMEAHAKVQFRCPGCLRIFKKVSGMVSHMEMTSKCGIRQSKSFKSVLDDITGGLLKAKRLAQPKVQRTTDVVPYGETVGAGVMGVKYERPGQDEEEFVEPNRNGGVVQDWF